MSRSCHSATFSSAGHGVAAQHAREAADALARDRVALVRHRRGALLARGANGSSASRTSRALQVADLGREAVERRCRGSRARQQLGVAVARDDLRGDVLDAQAERRQRELLDARVDVAVGADGARELADARRRRRRARRARGRGAGRTTQPSSLSPNVVGSACTPWVRPMHGVSRCSSARAIDRGERAVEPAEQLGAGVAQLQRERRCRRRRTTSARSGTSARRSPDLLGDRLGERDHVVVRAPLDLLRALDVDARLRGWRRRRRPARRRAPPSRRGPRARPRASGQASLVAPDGPHLRACVAGDHVVRRLPAGPSVGGAVMVGSTAARPARGETSTGGRGGDVGAALHAVERDQVGRGVGAGAGVGEVVAERGHAEHPPAGGHEAVAAPRACRRGTPDADRRSDASAASQPVISSPVSRRGRVAAGGQHDASRRRRRGTRDRVARQRGRGRAEQPTARSPSKRGSTACVSGSPKRHVELEHHRARRASASGRRRAGRGTGMPRRPARARVGTNSVVA